MAKRKKPRKLFGITLKTSKQKKFWKYFLLIKGLIYMIIFALAVYFLIVLRDISI